MGDKRFKNPRYTKTERIKSPDPVRSDEDLSYPVFCFMHLHGSYNVDCCRDKSAKAGLLKKLSMIGSMTWLDIHNSPREGAGSENIPINQLSERVPMRLSKDVTDLECFRFAGGNKKSRFLGHRKGSVFHILFIDPLGSLYNHGS